MSNYLAIAFSILINSIILSTTATSMIEPNLISDYYIYVFNIINVGSIDIY